MLKLEENKRLINFIDFVRWSAALLVLLNHARGLLFVEYDMLQSSSVFARAFYFLTGFGHQSVVIFFVLSGFLVGGKLLGRIQSNTFNARAYFTDRLTRLYIVVLPALLITLATDYGGGQIFNGQGLYSALPAAFGGYAPAQNISAGIFLGNAAFLQTITVPTLGSNGPLWSLAYEFWYYLLAPLLFWGLLGKGNLPLRLLCLLAVAAGLLLLRGQVGLYFPLWLFGAAIVYFTNKLPLIGHPLPAIALTLALMAVGRLNLLPAVPADYLLALTFALSLQALYVRANKTAFLARANQILAGFSFSLYAIHFPLIVLMATGLLSGRAGYQQYDQVGLSSLLPYAGVVLVLMLIAYVFGQLTEKNTGRLRSYLGKRLKLASR
jgi:peptidoglycan/LPS O-acetylase OafA/YrhL